MLGLKIINLQKTQKSEIQLRKIVIADVWNSSTLFTYTFIVYRIFINKTFHMLLISGIIISSRSTNSGKKYVLLTIKHKYFINIAQKWKQGSTNCGPNTRCM